MDFFEYLTGFLLIYGCKNEQLEIHKTMQIGLPIHTKQLFVYINTIVCY